jgi:hypothetical protein
MGATVAANKTEATSTRVSASQPQDLPLKRHHRQQFKQFSSAAIAR